MNYFEQFKPSKKILEQICRDEEELMHLYFLVPCIECRTEKLARRIDATLCFMTSGLTYAVADYYLWASDIQTKMNVREFAMIVLEPLRNALDHGSKDGGLVTIGLFLGPEGVCLGFRDQGDYFKLQETKKIFESRTLPENRGEKQSQLSGFGIGVGIMYNSADDIEVDAEKGILYCVKFKKNLAKAVECKS